MKLSQNFLLKMIVIMGGQIYNWVPPALPHISFSSLQSCVCHSQSSEQSGRNSIVLLSSGSVVCYLFSRHRPIL